MLSCNFDRIAVLAYNVSSLYKSENWPMVSGTWNVLIQAEEMVR